MIGSTTKIPASTPWNAPCLNVRKLVPYFSMKEATMSDNSEFGSLKAGSSMMTE
ncbi:MAG: hypothetical protein BWY67_02389 [Bacteroidetes bacterium ADurb.Bin397]|nr:MAG: hypothetical protein BWY67_02389 [Bacteroidetes bacterium ADurb.Bin397]